VTVFNPSGPNFGPGPSGPFEATVGTPYLGTTLDGKYAPTATDPVQGDISASIKTYLNATGQQIDLSGANSFLFPRGPTDITNVVTNGYGVTAQQTFAIVVQDTTPPAVTVAAPAQVTINEIGSVDYTGKVRTALKRRALPRPSS
jgi:hypothetical protein